MSMSDALYHLFPDAKDGDWLLQNDLDGKGVYIAQWNRPEPQPNQGQIQSVSQAQREVANANARFKREIANESKERVATITWIAGKHGLSYTEALAEIRTIWESL